MTQNPANQKYWHVIITRSRAEKKVHTELTAQEIECFLPIQKKLRQWKDRKKWVEMPVISGYCFVNIHKAEFEKVLKTNHVVNYLIFDGKPAHISAEQIDYLKKMLNQSELEVEVTHENFHPGKMVEVTEGPLIGVKGELVSCRGKNRFMLRITQMNTSYLIDINAEKLTICPEKI